MWGWSPDGKLVFATVTMNNQEAIYIISADGEDMRLVTNDLPASEFGAASGPTFGSRDPINLTLCVTAQAEAKEFPKKGI
jgi:hypothetical protein